MATSAHASSVDFRWESEMIAPILQARRKIAGTVLTSVIDARLEVPTAAGVPDVLLVEWNEEEIARRQRANLEPLLDLTKIRLIIALKGGPASIEELAMRVGVGASHLRRSVLSDLAERGWVDATNTGHICLQDGLSYEPLSHGLVTIEAKLRDWQKAFQQAARHRQSADASFIAVDAARSSVSLAHATELASEGVGLITVNAANGKVQVISRPRRLRRRTAEYHLLGEQAWRLRRRNQISGDLPAVFGRELPRPVVRELLEQVAPER